MANILVIEDQRQLCQLYGSVLGRSRHHVDLAYSGEDGVAQANQNRPDLIILDMMLPGMSGVEVARKLKESGVLPGASLIIATAVPDQAQPITQFCQTATVLTKPFQIKSLVSAVRHALEDSTAENGSLEPVSAI
jgi:DNA-binding response OmpR family regulator